MGGKKFPSLKPEIVYIHRGLRTRRLANLFKGKGVRQVVDLQRSQVGHIPALSHRLTRHTRALTWIYKYKCAHTQVLTCKNIHLHMHLRLFVHMHKHMNTVTLAHILYLDSFIHTADYYYLLSMTGDISLRSLRPHSRHLAGKLFHEF